MESKHDFKDLTDSIDDRKILLRHVVMFLLGMNLGLDMLVFIAYDELDETVIFYFTSLFAISILLAAKVRYCIYKENKLLNAIKDYNDTNSNNRLRIFFRIVLHIIFYAPRYKKYLNRK